MMKPRQPVRTISRRRLAQLGALGAGAALAAAGGSLAAFELRQAGRFYPGVSVGGMEVSGLSWERAVELMEARWRPFLDNPAVLRAGGLEWRPTAAEIGIQVDFMTSLREAFLWGRKGGIADRLGEQRDSWSEGRSWPVSAVFDRNVFAGYLEGLAAAAWQEAKPAFLELVDRDGKSFVLHPSQTGRSLGGLDLASSFAPDFQERRTQAVELPLAETKPAVETEAVQRVIELTEKLLRGEVLLSAAGKTWTIDRAVLSRRLGLKAGASGPEPEVELRREDFAGLMEEIARSVAVPPVEPKLRFDAESETFKFLTPPESGLAVDVEGLWSGIKQGLLQGESRVSVPVRAVQPLLVGATPSSLGLDQVFGVGASFFQGSSRNRAHNIQVGSKILDGVVVAPGETFDFNTSLGPVTYDAGFVDGLIIIANRTLQGIGGGLCQVSTTMFRAAFMAGLPVGERWQHIYRVLYYEQGPGNPPGFDASVFQPDLNMTFVNDTEGFLMVKTELDASKSRLRFMLMGRAPKRRVDMTSWRGAAVAPPPPVVVPNPELKPGERKQTEYAVAGMKAGVARKVLQDGKPLFEDEYVSNFRPWPARWEIGPDENGQLDTSGIEGLESS